MGTTFCKKKYVRAIKDTFWFKAGDTFEVISETPSAYRIIDDFSREHLHSKPTGFWKNQFETIPSNEEETPMTPTPLKIEAGKYYKTRGGLKAGPAERPRNIVGYSYDFVLEVNGFVKIYQSDGRNGSNNIGFFPEYDLVDIWIEPKPVVEFITGDVIVNPAKPNTNRKEVLLVTEKYYFLRDLVTLSEHSIKRSQIDGTWIVAPPPPKVTKKFSVVSNSGIILASNYTSETSMRNTQMFKGLLANNAVANILEITTKDDNGKLTMESRIIPA